MAKKSFAFHRVGDYGHSVDACEQNDPPFEFDAWIGNNLPGYAPIAGGRFRLGSRSGGKLPAVKTQRTQAAWSIAVHAGMPQEDAAVSGTTICLANAKHAVGPAVAHSRWRLAGRKAVRAPKPPAQSWGAPAMADCAGRTPAPTTSEPSRPLATRSI